MFKDDGGLVDDLVSLRNQLRLTERNLQFLGEQLSQSENELIKEDKQTTEVDVFAGHLALEDLQWTDPGCAGVDPGSEARTCTRASISESSIDREMETEASALRRKLNTVRQENASLLLENSKLNSDMEAAQLELASSKSRLRHLGTSAGARNSNVSCTIERIHDLEAQLDSQTKALGNTEKKMKECELMLMQSTSLAEQLRNELRIVKAELVERTRLGKRAEQQRNQALQNSESLTVAFKDFKEDVSERLRKVIESEGELKVSLMACDQEREELEMKCAELEKEKERLCHTVCELQQAQSRSESLSADRLQLQAQVQQLSDRLKQQQQRELQDTARLRSENEDLRLLTACQEQRVTQANREREQDRAELSSLEKILDRLHLRENRDGAFCTSPCLLPPLEYSSTAESLKHNPGERYQKLLAVLQLSEKEKSRQASAAQGLQERLTRAQEEITTLQTSVTERSAHYQQLHNQLLDKASQATTLEKELKKKSSRVMVLEKQVQEKSAACTQAVIKNSQLEQELLEKASSIQHYQSALNKKQMEYQQTLEKSKATQLHKCKELEDTIEMLQLTVAQKQSDVEALQESASVLNTEKLEAQQRTSHLQKLLDQLSEDFKSKAKHHEEKLRNTEEQALISVSKLRCLQTDLNSCKEELSRNIQQMEDMKKHHDRQLQLKKNELTDMQEELKRKRVACQSYSDKNLELQHSNQNQLTMLQNSTSRIAQLEESQSRLQSQVSQLEHNLEKERSALSQALRRREKELEESSQEVQTKERRAAELSGSITQLSSEMNKCRGELSEMEQELLRLRRDSNAKSSQLTEMEETLKETKGMLDKKSEIVLNLEEQLHRSEMDRRNSLQRAQALEGQLQEVRGELSDTLDHLQELKDVLQRTQLTSDQRQAAIDKLAAELRESQRELEERNYEVLDMDTVLKERQGELQQRAELLGKLDVAIRERKAEMEKQVEHLQEALEKSQKELEEKDQHMQFLTERLDMLKSQLKVKEDMERGAVEHGQQLRVYREQHHKNALELQEARVRCDSLNREVEEVTLRTRQKAIEVQQLQEEMSAMKKSFSQAEARHQATITKLQQELEQLRLDHHKEQTRGQLLTVSDQISSSLRSSQEHLCQRLQQAQNQLEEARATSAHLLLELKSTNKLLHNANDTLLIKESEIAHLRTKLSSYERASELHNITLRHKTSTPPLLSPPLKDSIPHTSMSPTRKDPSHSALSSWNTSNVSLEFSDRLKTNMELLPPSSPDTTWRGLSTHDATCTTDMSFNPLTYMLDQEGTDQSDLENLSGMLRFVNHTLSLQKRSSSDSNTHQPGK